MGYFDILLSSGANLATTIGLNEHNAKLNQHYWDIQNKKLYEQNEQSAKNAMQRSIDLYNLLQSPEALKKQYKKAGLNPALMYSSGGVGGHVTNGPQAQTQGGQGAPTLGLQQILDPLTLSQIKNIEADTNKKNAETKKTEWDANLSKWNSFIAELDNKLKEETYYLSFAKAYKELQILTGEAESALAKGYIDEETKETQIQLATAELANRQYQLEVMKSVKGLNDAERDKLKVDIVKMGQEIQNLIIEGELTEAKIWEINQKYGWNFNKEDLKWTIDSIIELVDTFVPNPFKKKSTSKKTT